jgi:hypothetical protein
VTWRARISSIPAQIADEMAGVSWHPEDPRCPRLDDLALVRLLHVDPAGGEREGELVVAAAVAEEVVGAFERLFQARFPIERMERVDAYGGSDDRSMEANNSSAFNFRTIAGSDELSLHALGRAIDTGRSTSTRRGTHTWSAPGSCRRPAPPSSTAPPCAPA